MMRTHSSLLHWLIAPLLLSVPLAMVPAQAQSTQAKPQSLGIGVYTFTSGPAAAYGVPGYNAAQVIIKEINAGGGVDGVPIKATYVDEAQGTEGVLAQFRRLSAVSSMQAMIAALSSSNCLALAPVAEQLKMPMVAWNCDTFQLFSDKHYEYVSRANSSVIPEFLSYALYFLQAHKDAKRIATHMEATFWYVLPSLPMFLVIPAMLRAGIGFWTALISGCVLTSVLYFIMSWILARFGIQL